MQINDAIRNDPRLARLWAEEKLANDPARYGVHLVGLRCPDCGHEWPGHAQVGVSAAICPECLRRIREQYGEDCYEPRPAAGEEYEGSREVPGCDRHGTVLPCKFCR